MNPRSEPLDANDEGGDPACWAHLFDVDTLPPMLVLTDAQRAHYGEHDWVSVPGLVDDGWLQRLRAVARRHGLQAQLRTVFRESAIQDVIANVRVTDG
ncbi:MAG: hypothetical protein JWL83_4775 [Actinomycetia bacterium]|nr:hypothetical protein [Actinomycetes bacterium]